RDRREDIPYLTAAFMRDCAARMRKPIHGLMPAAERMLMGAPWDGNVRELKNVVERACMLSDGTLVSERELAGAFGPGRSDCSRAFRHAPSGQKSRARDGGSPPPLEEIERDHILDV